MTIANRNDVASSVCPSADYMQLFDRRRDRCPEALSARIPGELRRHMGVKVMIDEHLAMNTAV